MPGKEGDPSQSMQDDPATETQAGPEQIVEGLQTIGDAMQSFQDNLGDKLPPEAMSALQQAQAAYSKFLQISMQSMGGGAQEPSHQDSMAMGSKNAMPADMPTGRNMQPA